MGSSEQYIKNAAAFAQPSGGIRTNAPSQYAGRQKQYLAERSALFDAERAYLSSDYVNADVQGLTADFYEWTNTNIRMSDIIRPSASLTRKNDDVKQILLPELAVDYLPIGAKIQAMGSTWICINPSNISSARATAIVYRCNTAYNSYDCYGNVVSEPIVIEKSNMLGNDNESPENLILMDGYFHVICQLNDNTRRLGQNKRIILGTKAYYITGFTDFIREFTNDRDSVHLLDFTVRIEEPTEADDVTVNFIAGGNTQSFEAIIGGAESVQVGELTTYTAQFVSNGEIMHPTEDCPITWEWTSSDHSVATVDVFGNVSGIAEGSAQITATLAQNPNVSATASITVSTAGMTENVSFIGYVQSSVRQYTSAVYTAFYFRNGERMPNGVTFSFSGAAPSCYLVLYGTNDDLANSTVSVDLGDMLLKQYFAGESYNGSELSLDDGVLYQTSDPTKYNPVRTKLVDGVLYAVTDELGFNQVMITAVKPSPVPLTITASYGGVSKSIIVDLEGY